MKDRIKYSNIIFNINMREYFAITYSFSFSFLLFCNNLTININWTEGKENRNHFFNFTHSRQRNLSFTIIPSHRTMFKQLSREPFLIWADRESNRPYVRHLYIEILSRWPPTFQPNSYFSQMESIVFITQSVPKTNSLSSSNSHYSFTRFPRDKKKPNFPKSMRLRFVQPILIFFPEKKIYFYEKERKKRYINFPTLAVSSMWHRSTRQKFTFSRGMSRMLDRVRHLERSRLSFKAERSV